MPITISPAVEADFRTLVDVNFDTFQPREHPVVDTLFPHHDTPAGRATAVQRYIGAATVDASGHYLKMVDDTTGQMIGQGRWGIVPPDPNQEYPAPTLKGDYWVSDEDRLFAQWCIGAYTERRRATFRKAGKEGRTVFSVTSLTVLPQHEGKGAASLFLRWGTQQADAVGAECIVEAALRGASFYERHGFVPLEHVKLVPPEKWSKYGTQEYIWMVRTPHDDKAEA
ncbi:hypothetical protein C8R44DRAFT_868399 [Mycena epipterygia]|nr:hypothetical protein C8R44DRAFT_868399 [Mycena epipterygia]